MQTSIHLERLYDEHAQALFAFLLNLTRNEADTKDVLQNLFLKLAEKPQLLDGVREERPFLIRLVHNLAIDWMRRRSTREKNYAQLEAESILLFAKPQDPDEQIYSEALSKALGELPVEQRAVVHLKLREGFTFEEIAAALDLSINTVASRYRYCC